MVGAQADAAPARARGSGRRVGPRGGRADAARAGAALGAGCVVTVTAVDESGNATRKEKRVTLLR